MVVRLAAVGVALGAAVALGAGACGSTAHTAASTTVASVPTTTAASATGGCSLPTTPELIERTVRPDGPAVAVLIGSANTVLCEPTTKAFRAGVPTDPGWCSTLARFDDNPHYDVNAVPAPPLQKVIASAGAAC